MFPMPDKEINVIAFHFQKGSVTNFEGHFTLDSNDTELKKLKKETYEAKSELPKYQLILMTGDGSRFQVIDCWIEKFENPRISKSAAWSLFVLNIARTPTTLFP